MSSPKIILWTAWICYDMSQTTQKTTWVSHGTWMCCVQQRKLHQMAPHHPWKVHWSHYQDWHHGSRHRCRQDVTGLKCCGARVGDLPVSIVVGFCANLNYVHYWNPSAWVGSNSFNRWWWISNDHSCSSVSTLPWKLGSRVQLFWQHLSYAGAVRNTGFQSQVATRREPPPLPRLRGEDIPLRWSLDWGLVELTIARPCSSWWLIRLILDIQGYIETEKQQNSMMRGGRLNLGGACLKRKFCWLYGCTTRSGICRCENAKPAGEHWWGESVLSMNSGVAGMSKWERRDIGSWPKNWRFRI